MADDQENTPEQGTEEQTATDKAEQPRPRMGFLPKLVLWSLVLLFGFLYLGSLERQPGEPLIPFTKGGDEPSTPEAAAPRVSESAPAPQSAQQQPAATPSAPTSSSAPVAKAPPAASEPTEETETAAAPKQDIGKQEAEAFAQALMKEKPAPSDSSAAKASARTAASETSPSETSKADAGKDRSTDKTAAAEANEPTSAAKDVDKASKAPAAPADWAAQRRAQMEAYYTEQRRQAEAFARQRWEEMRRMQPAAPPMPPVGPYGAYGHWPAPAAPGYYPNAPTAPRSN